MIRHAAVVKIVRHNCPLRDGTDEERCSFRLDGRRVAGGCVTGSSARNGGRRRFGRRGNRDRHRAGMARVSPSLPVSVSVLSAVSVRSSRLWTGLLSAPRSRICAAAGRRLRAARADVLCGTVYMPARNATAGGVAMFVPGAGNDAGFRLCRELTAPAGIHPELHFDVRSIPSFNAAVLHK